MNALGFIEVSGIVAAVDALDIMCKAADVHLVTWERKLGGRLVTLIVTGNVAAVTAAVEAVRAQGIKPVICSNVIPRPHTELVRVLKQTFNYQRCNQETHPQPTENKNHQETSTQEVSS